MKEHLSIHKVIRYLFVFFSLFVTSCSLFEDEEEKPTITDITPLTGDYGIEVTITGNRFSTAAGGNEVWFENKQAEILSASVDQLVVTVPAGARSGAVKVIADGNQVVSSQSFTVTAGKWQKRSHINVPFGSSTLEFMIDDKVYLLKPRSSVNGEPVDATFWQYDPSGDSWTEKQVISKDFSRRNDAFWGTRDKGYYLAGRNLWEYQPESDQWVQKEDVPFLSFPEPLYSFYIESVDKAFLISLSGSVYSYNHGTEEWDTDLNVPFADDIQHAWGYTTSDETSAYIVLWNDDIWRYSVSSGSGSWEKIPDNPFELQTVGVIFTIDQKLYVGSSSYDIKLLTYFSEADQKWHQKADQPESRIGAVVVSNGRNAYWGYGENEHFIYDWYEFIP